MPFFHDLSDNPLLVNGLIAGLLASFACGLIGPYVVTRRFVFLAGAIAHMAVGGIGLAIFLRYHVRDWFGWFEPIYGAMFAAVIGAVVITLVHQYVRERLDTLIGAMWAVGMTLGILLVKLTPGYYAELMSYLFGNIAAVPGSDLWLMAGLNAVMALAVLLFHKRILAICLDEQFADLQGVSPLWTNLVLLVLVSLTVVVLIQIVGVILVIALLALPAATAAHHLSRMAPIMLASMILSVLLTTLPRIAVYDVTALGAPISPEAAIVLAAAVLYLASVLAVRVKARFARR